MLPVFSRFDGVNDQSGQVGGISRRSHLVKYDIQLLPFHCQTLYGLYKIIPESRIQPGCPEDQVTTSALLYSLFSCQLRPAVSTQRIGRFILPVRQIPVSAEHIIS